MRRLEIFLAGLWGLAPAVALAQSTAKPSAPAANSPAPQADSTPLEQRPYVIRVWFTADPSARMTRADRDRLVADWLLLTERFAGPSWKLELAPDDGPLRGRDPESLTADEVVAATTGADKGWLIQASRPPTGAGWLIAGREFDAATRQLGPIQRQLAPFRRDTARSLLQLSQRVFSPTAEVVRQGPAVSLRVQGSALPVPEGASPVAPAGTVFRPFWVFLQPDGSIRGVRDIPYTYLRIPENASAASNCEVVSGLRRPLPQQVSGRYRLLALGSRPSSVPTTFRFVSRRASDGQLLPVPGAVLTARPYPDGVPRTVGTTGRDGEITLPPDFSPGLVTIRLLAGGVEPLREIPILPGETDQVREIPVEPRPLAVALEYRAKAIQDEIVDLIARRGFLENRLEARTQGKQWDEVKKLLDDYRKLPTRDQLAARVKKLREDAQKQQVERKVPILTQTSQALLNEVDGLVSSYLDDTAFKAYQEAYDEATATPTTQPQAASATGTMKLPSPPPATPAPAAPPSASAPPPAATTKPAAPAPAPARTPPAGGGGAVPF